jgi:predicted RNase H-like nuclease (RuvC/YqgF family)
LDTHKLPELFVAGLDSGAISAYVILDLNENLIEFQSFKNSSPEKIIHELTKKGRIVLLGSDVRPASSLTKKVSQKIGSKILEPDHNPGFFEKIRVVDAFLKKQKIRFPFKNKHEKDALASALFGLKQIKTLLSKIDNHLEQIGKPYLINRIRYKVLIENKPITVAVKEAEN